MCKTTTRERPLPKKAVTPDCQASIIFAADVLDLVPGDGGWKWPGLAYLEILWRTEVIRVVTYSKGRII